MDIRASVGEGREEEACLRQVYHPVPDTVLEGVLHRIVAQARLGQFHRADAGEDVFIDLIGGIFHVDAVRCPARHIVGVMDQQDQVVAHILVVCNDPVIVLFQQGIVLQPAVPEAQQEFLGTACAFAGQGEFQGEQVLTQGAG